MMPRHWAHALLLVPLKTPPTQGLPLNIFQVSDIFVLFLPAVVSSGSSFFFSLSPRPPFFSPLSLVSSISFLLFPRLPSFPLPFLKISHPIMDRLQTCSLNIRGFNIPGKNVLKFFTTCIRNVYIYYFCKRCISRRTMFLTFLTNTIPLGTIVPIQGAKHRDPQISPIYFAVREILRWR